MLLEISQIIFILTIILKNLFFQGLGAIFVKIAMMKVPVRSKRVQETKSLAKKIIKLFLP